MDLKSMNGMVMLSKIQQIKKLIAAAPDLLEACQKAMSLVNLWSYGDIGPEHEGEAQALQAMKETIEKAIKKATE